MVREAIAVLLLSAAAAWSQEPHFETRAREVEVTVSVSTRRGSPVENLSASDFIVLNDGVQQRVRLVSRDSDALPIDAVLVLQANDGSEAALAKIRKTASIITSYITNDMGTGRLSFTAVMTVSDDVRVAQDFTADAGRLGDVFDKLKADGSSSGRLLDGVSTACDLLAARSEPARRVIVVIGESRDRQSKSHFAGVIAKAEKLDVVIYTISYSAYATAFTQKAPDRPAPPDEPGVYDSQDHGGIPLLALGLELARLAKLNIAEALAQATGGGHEKFTTLRGLKTQLTAIGTEIHNRYTLTFVPPAQPAGYHQLTVTLKQPGNWRVHARTGYWSAAE